jgi:mono/diheme cytochrome c family protein
MPWNYFRGINDKDLTSVYDFLKSLGPKGDPATPYATSTPTVAVDPKAPTATANSNAPTTTVIAAAATKVPPTATPRPDLLAQDKAETAPTEAYVKADTPELAGEYIIWVGRCNSCHTADLKTNVANWTETTPKDDWLMGGRKSVGNYGTVYSANLRLTPQNYTEDEFVKMMKTRSANPPMPWFALHQFNEKDLRSVYAFLKSMGPKGDPVTPFVPDPAGPPPATPATYTK